MNNKISFHNTINLPSPDLAVCEQKAKTQQDIILEFFKARPNQLFTPFQIWESCFDMSKTPITSVRRSISDLTDEGHLRKSAQQKEERLGHRNYTWVYSDGRLF